MNRSIYIMALGAFGIITTEFGVIGILPALAKEFSISIDTAGWLLSAFALTVALTGPFTTALTARINRKTILAMVLAVFVVSNILSAFAPSFTFMMIARILPAFLHPVFWAVAASVAAREAGPKDAPKAVATVMAGLSIATVLGVPLTTYMADLFNWQASFYLAAFINLIAFAGMILLVPSMPVSKERSSNVSDSILRSPFLWIKLSTTLVMLAGMFATYSYLAEFLSKITQMSGAEISIMLLVFGGAGIAGNWAMGIWLSRNVMLTTRVFLLSLVLTHILAFQFGGYFVPMVIILSIWGFIHTGGFLAANIHLTAYVPQQSLELVNSLLPSFYNAGITVGSLMGGYVIAHYGTKQVIWMAVPLLLLAYGMSFYTQKKTVATAEFNEDAVSNKQPEPVLSE
ncbi:MFS transporter [Pseudobacter ginsenosidimutans]|uniref:Putative MFS family arabinose efflux permease n=1 Tax=Pseudobacter ginsenosidimutans TaxID=661488 RepID=A0A4Q7N317_9BACT|nr:MFS transporter [Pseudobacter ginsenosidimutans]QEC44069.1 MFS transporter [Pseudobacter ginsenosidimutans]RZS75509.1 putative MFS family arabinose efflux permease [Pseudobacter ginsenosidimutans]